MKISQFVDNTYSYNGSISITNIRIIVINFNYLLHICIAISAREAAANDRYSQHSNNTDYSYCPQEA